MPCVQCGAPIELSTTTAVTCRYCDTVNQPMPKEVPVPVPVNVVHNVVQVVGGEAPRELRCPHCRKRLVGAEVGDVTLHGCGGCGGIWVDNESARAVLASPAKTLGVLAQRAAKNATGAVRQPRPTCALCPAVLDKVHVHGIELDICRDHGTWFDALELSRLTAVLRGEEVRGVTDRPVSQDARCASCKGTFPSDRLNITDSGALCDACWRGEQATLIRAAEREHTSATGVAAVMMLGLAGAMLGAASRSSSS
jgi:Zn-finger nucleic acid-binding protein